MTTLTTSTITISRANALGHTAGTADQPAIDNRVSASSQRQEVTRRRSPWPTGPREFWGWLALFAGAVLACLSACAAEPAKQTAHAPVVRALHDGPLTDYVPAAGLRWLVVARPRELSALAGLFADERLKAFEQSSGISLPDAAQALAAGFDFSTLYAVKMTRTNRAAIARFTERIVAGATPERAHPDLVRVSGIISGDPETLVAVGAHTLAIATGAPTPARVFELFAQGKLKKTPLALEGAGSRTLPLHIRNAPLYCVIPAPVNNSWRHGAHGLLGVATATAIVVNIAANTLRLDFYFAGEWEPVSDLALLTATLEDLRNSDLGRLLALDAPAAAPTATATAELLSATLELQLDSTIAALRALTIGNVREIMELSRQLSRDDEFTR